MLSTTNWSELFSYQINLLCTFFLVVSIIMILGAAYGFWAGYRCLDIHLSIFWGLMILCAFILMVIGVLGITLPARMRNDGCGSTYYQQMSAINVTATQAIQTICASCTCFYNTSNSSVSPAGLTYDPLLVNLPVKAQSCSTWSITSYDDILANM